MTVMQNLVSNSFQRLKNKHLRHFQRLKYKHVAQRLSYKHLEIIVISSDSSDDDRKGPSKASVPIFKGPSVQGLLDYYGYNDIEEYLSRNYFSSTNKKMTDKNITDKDILDEDCIHESNYVMSKGQTLPVSKLGCVLSQNLVAFCLEDFLRFVSRPPAFCLKTYCVLSQDTVAFCLKTWLRFVSRPLAFCLKTYCVLSQDCCVLLYCRGKKNGVNILKSIDEGPYQMGTVREPFAEGTEGAPQLGPARPRVYYDLSQEEKDRYNADIRATNILLQGLPKDIYTLINHYTDAKDI
nr:integrase, catalytic region, zinc finger, CCHC-type, peptidase aspartic, catalytic [Tanacetum cinerariifolium]